jgi:murein L,D-transpeptidase YafK
MSKVRPQVVSALQAKGLSLGQPVFMRIFKMSGELEVWVNQGTSFKLFKTYPICTYSGYPGPKLYEGDWQSPEGFYTVRSDQLNPNSQYHLSFDVGYPNSFDRARKRTGSSIMVHGDCSSRGCFAMGDSSIEEIYLMTHSALAQGQPHINLHIFPFRMTAKNLQKFQKSPWISFWKTLQQGFLAFESTHRVPEISVYKGKYVVNGDIQLAMTAKKTKRRYESVQ